MLIQPHGGKLVQRMDNIIPNDKKIVAIELNAMGYSDLLCIAVGAFSPLEGFMNRKDYDSVLQDMRLSNGLVWSIPITLMVSKDEAESLAIGERAFLSYQNEICGSIEVEDLFVPDKEAEAFLVYGTKSLEHPGVNVLMDRPEVYVGGKITMYPANREEYKYCVTPADMRASFLQKKWKTIVAFQTRNPIHRAHEYLQKTALESVDGLLVHPLLGVTKGDDIPADVRWKCYKILLDHYYPKDRVMLSGYPGSMRYAGPREAILHALVRKNYGCTHFIVGRDHAGVGDYYGTYDAQKIFSQFLPEEIGIIPFMFEHTFYCKRCEGMASYKTCPHSGEDHILLSGTKVRERLKKGEAIPPEFSRKEVVEVLRKEWIHEE